MRILSEVGVEKVSVFDSENASIIGSYWNAVRHFLGSGDVSVLDTYRGVTIGGIELETDPDAIEDFDSTGELDFRDIYDK
jgi:hypothetical protein